METLLLFREIGERKAFGSHGIKIGILGCKVQHIDEMTEKLAGHNPNVASKPCCDLADQLLKKGGGDFRGQPHAVSSGIEFPELQGDLVQAASVERLQRQLGLA